MWMKFWESGFLPCIIYPILWSSQKEFVRQLRTTPLKNREIPFCKKQFTFSRQSEISVKTEKIQPGGFSYFLIRLLIHPFGQQIRFSLNLSKARFSSECRISCFCRTREKWMGSASFSFPLFYPSTQFFHRLPEQGLLKDELSCTNLREIYSAGTTRLLQILGKLNFSRINV